MANSQQQPDAYFRLGTVPSAPPRVDATAQQAPQSPSAPVPSPEAADRVAGLSPSPLSPAQLHRINSLSTQDQAWGTEASDHFTARFHALRQRQQSQAAWMDVKRKARADGEQARYEKSLPVKLREAARERLEEQVLLIQLLRFPTMRRDDERIFHSDTIVTVCCSVAITRSV